MAISLSYFPILRWLLHAIFCLHIAEAATVTYDFNITWVTANPDGLYDRPTIGINGQWPLPVMRATIGDQVVVKVNNQLGNQSTSLHFHGLFQNGSTSMDGPSQVSQCPIPSGSQFTYNFTVNQPGTYWYHSHNLGQYPDGLRAPLIISDPDLPYNDQVDEEVVISVSDWYHEQMQTLIPKFIYKGNPTGAEPVPQATLMNDTQNLTISVEPGKTYLFRMVNLGAFAGQYIWFEGHNMTIIEVDGVYTETAEAEMIYIGAAQRCSFLITTKNETTTNYAFVASMDTSLFDITPSTLNWNSTGWLVYDKEEELPTPAAVDELDPFDDFTLVPYDNQTLLPEPDQTITFDVVMGVLGNGKPYAFFDNITYVAPKVPTLYTVMSAGQDAANPLIYGEYTHSFVLEKDQIIEIVVNNHDSGKHPFHLHGHNFQAIARSAEDGGDFDATNSSLTDYPAIPIRRDTFVLYPNGHIVMRFKADNPGVWLFHCHIEWHMDQGLIATMVEAPLDLQKSLTIPEDHLAACQAGNVPSSGNAAANTVNFLDLSGQNAAPAPLPAGFTPRGIVALTFSAIAALLGLAVIVWYGMADMDFIASFVSKSGRREHGSHPATLEPRRFLRTSYIPTSRLNPISRDTGLQRSTCRLHQFQHKPQQNLPQSRGFHDYFVTNLPSSSLHPDSRSSTGPHHKLPRSASTPHTPGKGPSPAAAPPMVGPSRELTVVRIPLRSAKHHFGVSVSRGTRPYNEDTYQAGTLDIPAFAKRAPISLSRSGPKSNVGGATSADSASGDPQVFYFGVFDGHGGHECSDFLREELHNYVEKTAELFELGSSLKGKNKQIDVGGPSRDHGASSELSSKGRESLNKIDIKNKEDVEDTMNVPTKNDDGSIQQRPASPTLKSEEPVSVESNKPKTIELEKTLVTQWKETVGGYFRRFRPEYFSLPSSMDGSPPADVPVTIETVLMYAFLKADLDFITAQARKPDPDVHSDNPLNEDDILGEPARLSSAKNRIGGPTRFVGGSTASIVLISTPSPTPFWHPASPSTIAVAHVGDTRILLCATATGLAKPVTTNHHPSTPIESTRLRRYAATFVTDSFGEERMSGLANTRAFGDMRSKRIGVSAEPEIRRVELAPAEYSFLVLVSDGVSGTLSDQEIVDVVKEAKTPEQGAKDVVAYATEVSREGDNATCLVVRLGGWERRVEGGMGSMGTKEVRDYKRREALDPRRGRT
ncbi:hypothetical protein G7Y89_g556 [Cudoniella acicularis]|uniref:PPM-type phosphatase domain-containing protein n=1 Tax=Cudoniella acicularis TaxID=354080 RepID=A0A8H4W8R4_9HELO|nr:hypothetical protein G7Y89_g556 [Cudoniella acicularis]